MTCNHYSSNSFHAIVMPFDIPDHSKVFYGPKKSQMLKFAFWSFSVQVFTSNSLRSLRHRSMTCNHYSSNSFHSIVLPFGILDHSEVLYAPKKNQIKKINFGLFSTVVSDSSGSENDTRFQRSRGIGAGWKASGDQESLETTLLQTYFMLWHEKLPWVGRIRTFQTLAYNKIGQLSAVAEL